MSNAQNDINQEALLDELRANYGAWYRNLETLEEAVKKSKNANMIGSNRLGFARALRFIEVAPNIFVRSQSEANVAPNNQTTPAPSVQVDDTSDDDYEKEVDDNLSFGTK